MACSLLPILTFLSLALSVSHAATTFQDYWNQMLPNTPMPSAVRDHIRTEGAFKSNDGSSQSHPDGMITHSITVDSDTRRPQFDYINYSPDGDQPTSKSNEGRSHNHDANIVSGRVSMEPDLIYHYRKVGAGVRRVPEGEAAAAGDSGSTQGHIDRPGAPGFFLEKDLRVGARIKVMFKRGLSGDNFLHREAAETIPFSSDKLPEILRRFSVQPGTLMAKGMERTLRHCEFPAARGEKNLCATSLEAVVDFVISSMGTHDLRTLATVVSKDAPNQVYTVESWSAVPSPNWTTSVCHVGVYPYTIFHCHMIPMTKPYVVKLVGEDGTRVDSAVLCHADTSTWSETLDVMRAFSLKPGEATAVCHIVLDGEVVWIPLGGVGKVAAA